MMKDEVIIDCLPKSFPAIANNYTKSPNILTNRKG